MRSTERDCLKLFKRLPRLGLAETMMALRLIGLMVRHPKIALSVLWYMLMYMQIRHMFKRGEFWDPQLAKMQAPWSEYPGCWQKAS